VSEKTSLPAQSSPTVNAADHRQLLRGQLLRGKAWLYLLALCLTVATVAVEVMLGGWMRGQPPASLLIIPIVVSAYLGGLGPGLLATVVGGFATFYVLIPPAFTFTVRNPADHIRYIAVTVSGALVSALSEALHRSRRRAEADNLLRTVTLRSISDGVITTDADGRVTFLNAEAESLTGWRSEVAKGQALNKVFYIADREKDKRPEGTGSRISWSGTVVGSVNRAVLLDRFGKRIPIENTRAPIRSSEGSILGMVLVFRDCSLVEQAEAERLAAEEALRESEEQMRLLFETVDSGVFVTDAKGIILTANRTAEQMFDVRVEAARGKTCYELFETVSEDGRPRQPQDTPIQRALATRKPVRAETVGVKHPSRGMIWLLESAHPVLAADGSVRQVIVTCTSVTALKQAQEALRQSEEAFYTLFQESPEMAVLSDAETLRYIDVNLAYCELFGVRKDTRIGLRPTDINPAFDYGALHARVIREGKVEGVEIASATGDRVLLLSARKVMFHGRACILSTLQDITSRKQAEAVQLRSQKLEALGTLAGGIAHDFNNILLAIRGNAQLIAMTMPPDHSAQQYVGEISKASGRAADLVRRILAFSRPHEQDRSVIQLQPAIEEALRLARVAVPAAIEIRTRFQPQLPPAVADSTQIHQVIVNLATNAAHAIGDRRGLIQVDLDAMTVDGASLSLVPDLKPGRYLRLSVSDDGCGMDEAIQKRIFDPFFTTKPVGKGTGLGLSVVHGIMKSHGGGISVYSDRGKGSVFHLYFPAAGEPVPAAAPEAARLEGKRAGRLLYVDDEEALVFLVQLGLQRLGYQVTALTDAAQALREFRARPWDFDAVVTDLSMPGMSGFHLAQELLATRPDVPILVTSGYLRPEDQQEAKRIGVRGLTPKPDTIEELCLSVDRLFRDTST
jgi:PAS domain S-box-containing protein